MADNLPRLDQETLASNSGQNVTRVNNLARIFDAFIGSADVIDRDLLTPPGSPAEGDLYLLPDSGTLLGDWSTFTNGSFAIYLNGAWYEIEVSADFAGVQIRIQDEASSRTYSGTAWDEVERSVDAAVTATGTTQGTGYAITEHFTEFAVVAGGANAATLPAARVGDKRVIKNADSTDSLSLFPASGDAIDGLGTNNALTVTAGSVVELWAVSATQWYSK